jgi:hypothetical protein
MNTESGAARIEIPKDKVAEFCRKNHIRTLSLFGSVLRDDFGPESDIDVLVEFDPEHIPGLMALVGMEFDLSDLLGGRKVDLVTKGFINHRLRDRILSEAVEQYAER